MALTGSTSLVVTLKCACWRSMMPDVTPDDVRLIVCRASESPNVEIVQQGDPSSKDDATVSGVHIAGRGK
jgi:hypothetical protein